MVTGSVNTQAITIFLTVPPCRFFMPLDATMVPAIPELNTCVVLTGHLYAVAKPMVIDAINSADAPCAYVKWSLPIFSPMVITILFQPIIVPKPNESAIIHMTQAGAKSVTPAIPVAEEAPKAKKGALSPCVAFFKADLSSSERETDSLSINF